MPDVSYSARAVSAKLSKTTNGHPQGEIVVKITGGKYDGTLMTRYHILDTENGPSYFKRDLDNAKINISTNPPWIADGKVPLRAQVIHKASFNDPTVLVAELKAIFLDDGASRASKPIEADEQREMLARLRGAAPPPPVARGTGVGRTNTTVTRTVTLGQPAPTVSMGEAPWVGDSGSTEEEEAPPF